MELLNEGGNVFKTAEGNPATTRVARENVIPTVQWLEQLTGLNLLDNMLGSTGRKETSGDLDLGVDKTKITKDVLIQQLLKRGIKLEDIRKSGDSVHLKTPILGDASNGYVQTDFMFGDPEFQKFALNTGESNYKGVHRAILLASIAKAQGMKWSYKNGLMDRETNKVISKEPTMIAKRLINGTIADLSSVETIINKIKTRSDYDILVKDAREAFEKDGVAFNETNAMARLRDRIINQGMQIIVEAARIEHPEDLIFEKGSRGAEEAINMLRQLPKQAKHITIKWDGRPAITFGRNGQGQFVLTDKSGFTSKSYQGLATTPGQLEKIMLQRGGNREELINMYKTLWAPLEKQTPKDFRGFIQGDLLYVGTPNMINNEWIFQPNTVEYKVQKDSDIGKQIGNSIAAVVIHTFKKSPNDAGTAFSDTNTLSSGQILILSPKLVETPTITIPLTDLNKLSDIVTKHSNLIDQLFNPQVLRDLKLANLPALMKQYGNHKVRQGNFENMASEFITWAEASVSEPKLKRIDQFLQQNRKALALIFMLFDTIQLIKTRVVRQLDVSTTHITASVDQEPGHEGYVTSTAQQPLKLVDRLRFSRANFARNS